MSHTPLYPLRFEPIFQYRLWGGRRLGDWLAVALPGDGPIGEAWILSDRADHASRVADGPLKGQTLSQLLEKASEGLLGKLSGQFDRFPLLLKFLDAREVLSIQVHPSDEQTAYLPVGEHGKTEAWVVLEASPQSRIYAGLKPDTGAGKLRSAITKGTVIERLASFQPTVGDAVFLPAGTVHSLGGGVVVFEVQQNSDVTFRLDDWGRTDARTGQPRPLQIERALACIDFAQGTVDPVRPFVETATPAVRERLFECKHFSLWRLYGEVPFPVGAKGVPRVLVGIGGAGQIEHQGGTYSLGKGDVILLPAAIGACVFRPHGPATLLEVALPQMP